MAPAGCFFACAPSVRQPDGFIERREETWHLFESAAYSSRNLKP